METRNEAGATLQFGVVSALDEANGWVRVRFAHLDGLESGWLPVLQAKTYQDKHWCLPDVGEHVAALLDNRGEDGVVMGAIYGRDAPPVADVAKTYTRYADGTTVEYDRNAHALAVHCVGPVTIVAAGPVTVQAPSVTLDTPGTTCTGDVLVKGKLTYQGGMAGSGGSGAAASIQGNVQVDGGVNASGSIMDGGGNSNHHSHG